MGSVKHVIQLLVMEDQGKWDVYIECPTSTHPSQKKIAFIFCGFSEMFWFSKFVNVSPAKTATTRPGTLGNNKVSESLLQGEMVSQFCNWRFFNSTVLASKSYIHVDFVAWTLRPREPIRMHNFDYAFSQALQPFLITGLIISSVKSRPIKIFKIIFLH